MSYTQVRDIVGRNTVSGEPSITANGAIWCKLWTSTNEGYLSVYFLDTRGVVAKTYGQYKRNTEPESVLWGVTIFDLPQLCQQ